VQSISKGVFAMTRQTDRRRFLKTGAAIGIGYWIAGDVQARESRSANERVAIACVGVGGTGAMTTSNAKRRGGDVVALCDFDERRLEFAGPRFPKAKRFTDFRKMLEKMEGSIDAVTISTPDHTRAPIGLMAMRMGKHCFCQTPLAHAIYEARLMGKVARERRVATQVFDPAYMSVRRAGGWIRAGLLGTVREVHVWSNTSSGSSGMTRPEPSDCPPHLKWDLWLGPAPYRPYAEDYHPIGWRRWWDFGTGTLGEQGWHQMNTPFCGLDLRNPIAVEAETSGHNRGSFPSWAIVTYHFAANDRRPDLKLVWYDGGKRPDRELFDGQDPPALGTLVIGAKAKLCSLGPYGSIHRIIGNANLPRVGYERSPHYFEQWIQAIKTGKPTTSDFSSHAGPLTEVVLLGNLAIWLAAGGRSPKIQWDAQNMIATNVEGLEPLIKPAYREGYTLDV